MSEQPMSDNSFSRIFIGMVIAMTLLTGVLMLLASINASDINEKLKAEKDIDKTPSIIKQISPVGTVAIGSANTTPAPATPQIVEVLDGETVYNGACAACHSPGIAGAPKTGDANQWADRVTKGADQLYTNAINGIGAMPARGGQAGLSDEAVKAAVDYILNASK